MAGQLTAIISSYKNFVYYSLWTVCIACALRTRRGCTLCSMQYAHATQRGLMTHIFVCLLQRLHTHCEITILQSLVPKLPQSLEPTGGNATIGCAKNFAARTKEKHDST